MALNVNIGVLGHVDSGKTSLVRALSTELSTAALDKHPQSQERGITLDLGFSGFSMPPPPAFVGASTPFLPCSLAFFRVLEMRLRACECYPRLAVTGCLVPSRAALILCVVCVRGAFLFLYWRARAHARWVVTCCLYSFVD